MVASVLGEGHGRVCDTLMDRGRGEDDLRRDRGGKGLRTGSGGGQGVEGVGRQAWTQRDLVAAFKRLKCCPGGGSWGLIGHDEKPGLIKYKEICLTVCTVKHQHRGSEFPITRRAQPGLGSAWWGYCRIGSQTFFFQTTTRIKI